MSSFQKKHQNQILSVVFVTQANPLLFSQFRLENKLFLVGL